MGGPPSLQKDKSKRQRRQYHRGGEIPPGIENTSNPTVRLRCADNADAGESPATAHDREERKSQARPKASAIGVEAPKNGRETSPNGDKPVCPKHGKGQVRLWWNECKTQCEPTGSEEAN